MSRRRARRLSKFLRWAAAGLAVIVLAALAPIIAVETACRSPADDQTPPGGGRSSVIEEPGYGCPEARSYLSYPEWYIVHAYEDFAGVLRHGDEHAFDYLTSIAGFWTSLCNVNRVTSRTGESHAEMKVMLYTIGLSFSVEMAVKGLYEETLGRVTAWVRGPERTAEDAFALSVADDYATFLRQTPWYEYPFGATVGRLWSETPFAGPDMLRKIERRAALTLEWGAKAAYAFVIGQASAATLGAADLRIRSVVQGLDRAALAADPRVTVLRAVDGDKLLIETPRYRAFTELLREIALWGGNVVEIAGNDDVLVTVIRPADNRVDADGVREIFSVPMQARPGWRRAGLDVKVTRLAALMRELRDSDIELEHVYDY